MALSTLKPIEKRLLKMAGLGHPDRRIEIYHRGERYRTAAFTWAELSAFVEASNEAIEDAVATLVAAGALDTTRQSSRVLRWFRVKRAVTLYFITKRGHRWLTESAEPAAEEASK